MGEYTKRRNKNRGYMNLDVWQKAIQLYKLIWESVHSDTKVDFKLRSQLVDSAQSVSANISEGYSRRSINEYIQYLYISLSTLSETMTRSIGLVTTNQILPDRFERIDELHYEVENKLMRLIASLEAKRDSGTWIDRIGEEEGEYNP